MVPLTAIHSIKIYSSGVQYQIYRNNLFIYLMASSELARRKQDFLVGKEPRCATRKRGIARHAGNRTPTLLEEKPLLPVLEEVEELIIPFWKGLCSLAISR